jgi:hypothetical protein
MVHTIFFRVTNNNITNFKNQAIGMFIIFVESVVPDNFIIPYFVPSIYYPW